MLEKHQQQYVKKHYRKRPARSIAKRLAVPLDEVRAVITSLKSPAERRRERLFTAFLALIPLTFFVLLESVLRVVEFGGSVELFQERILNGQEYLEINPAVKKRYFRNVDFDPAVSADIFAKKKSPDSYRIFCLGGSSTMGYPYLFNGSFSSMVKDRLVSLFPDRDFEVVNLGMTAVNSYTVLDFAKDILLYEPDLILVYAGHNEFYGALGIGSAEYLGRSRWIVKGYLSLQNLKTFWLVRAAIAWVSSVISSPSIEKNPGTLMERMAEKQSIPYGSDDYQVVLDVYRANLEEVAQLAQRAGVSVIVSTLVSNWRGVFPFVSTFSPQMDDAQKRQWNLLYEEGRRRMESGNFDEGAEYFDRCVALDALSAKPHYLLARCYERLGRYSDARQEYILAKDYDGLRFRASSDFNRVVAEVCSTFNIPVANAERTFAQESPNGIVGNELMLEHLHPNVKGYSLIAKAFVEAMAEDGRIAPREKWMSGREKSEEEYLRLAGVTRLDSIMANMRIKVLTNSWPFVVGSISIDDLSVQTDLEKLAKGYLMGELTWEQAHVYAAERYTKEKQYERAAEEYRAVLKQTPYNVSPYLRLGQVLFAVGNYQGAEQIFRKSLDIEETHIAHLRLASIYERRENFAEAVREIEQALSRIPANQRSRLVLTRYGLAVVLVKIGDTVRARSELEQVLRLDPDHKPATVLLNTLKAGQ